MRSFQQFLYEFGDRPLPWTMQHNLEELIEATFVPPLGPDDEPCYYSVKMVLPWKGPPRNRDGKIIGPTPPPVWEFGFALVRPLTTRHSTAGAKKMPKGYYYTTTVNDSRSSLAVLSTVFAIFQHFLMVKKPDRVIFSGKDAGRQQLYRRFIQRFAQSSRFYTAREERPGFFAVTRAVTRKP